MKCLGGGIGRRARLKIVCPSGMWVRFPPEVQKTKKLSIATAFFLRCWRKAW